MKKRISTRAICLLVAVAILAGALTVSAINGSPYESLKNAVFNALFYENSTMEVEVILRVDGQEYARAWAREYAGDESRLSHSAATDNLGPGAAISHSVMNYESSYLRITTISMAPSISEEWNRASSQQWYSVSRSRSTFFNTSIGSQMFNIYDRNSNQVRFAELLIDLLIGDLKNNLTISSQGDGVRRVSGAITESQLPELARVGIALVIEENLRWHNPGRTREDFTNVLDIPITSLAINRISGDADIDSDGNLIYVSANAHISIENIFGDNHEIEGEFTLSFSDIGTTVPEPLFQEVEVFATLFTASDDYDEWLALFEASGIDFEYPWLLRGLVGGAMYFTLDDEGNIDLNSIGTRPGYPSQSLRMLIEAILENRELDS